MLHHCSSLFLLLICCFCYLAPLCDCSNFLFFLIGTNQFERHTFEFLAQEFARRGHKVVTVKPILIPEEPKLVKPLLHFVHEKVLKDVLPKELYGPLERVGDEVPWRDNEAEEMEQFREPYWAAHNHSCKKMLDSNLMDVLAKSQIELAVLYVGNPCQLGLMHALGIPYALVDLEGLTDETIIASGAPWDLDTWDMDSGVSSVRDIARLIAARLSRARSLIAESFAQSDISWLSSLFSRRYRLLDSLIDAQFASDYEIGRKFRAQFPSVNKLKRMARLYLANTDPLLESPSMAFPANLIPIGGVHIDSVRPLFEPWNHTIASARDGLILCSFGTQANTSTMPEQLVRSLLGAFARLSNFRIIWRISPRLSLPGLSRQQMDVLTEQLPHLNITTFFPQNELLAHPRTRLLITNGGAHSLMEAIHWGVPMLGIPLYGVNRHNLRKVQQRGIGIVLEKRDAADDRTLLGAIQKVLASSKIIRRSKEFGRHFRGRPASAFDRVLYALESAARCRHDCVHLQHRHAHHHHHPFLHLLLHCLHFDVCFCIFGIAFALALVSIRIGHNLVAFCCAANDDEKRAFWWWKEDGGGWKRKKQMKKDE